MALCSRCPTRSSILRIPQAASLWLRNRQPQRWRERHQVDVADPGTALLDDLDEDALIERLMQRRALAQRKLS